ncbi:hypothetical protein VNI00_015260 [Paramarasmius palmivorus]|uniref:Uncharacterized protein n=1 Tax=Paramarasmius palmivorus TaxID=297713 RepID=A0AAW0BMW9_9AGAR
MPIQKNFHYEEAARHLQTLATERISTGYIRNPLANFVKGDLHESLQITPSETSSERTWHLTEQTHDDTVEEMVFTVQGYILQCDLPPVVRPYSKSVAVKHVQQRILLTGFNSPAFTNAIEGLTRIVGHLRSSVREYKPFTVSGSTGGYQTLDVYNRYFTSKRFATDEQHISFSKDIDPNGILEELRGDSFVHTADNVVEYYQRFREVQPSRIKNGDLVEVQLTVSLVETCTGKGRLTNMRYVTKIALRSITLLDETFSENGPSTYHTPNNRQNLKRKIGHDEEMAQETQDRLKRMAIDAERLV